MDVDKINDEITVLHYDDKVTVMSPYKLSKEEMDKVKRLIPAIEKNKMVNVVDTNIFSGLVVKVGSKVFDLTINGALQNLRKQIYESN